MRTGFLLCLLLTPVTLTVSCRKNLPPNQAAIPSGPESGHRNELLLFTSSATDPDNDSVAIRFDWGDGDTSDWSALVVGGAAVSVSHSWSAADTYTLRAQAKDARERVSVWSRGRRVIVADMWSWTFGGPDDDEGYSVQSTSDGGYIITGCTRSYGAGSADLWLTKTDATGNRLWDRTFGGTDYDRGNSVQQTSDGGYILTGLTYSYASGSYYDLWLVKTDPAGNKLWDKTFGGSNDDWGGSVQQTSDGGYIIAGWTYSYGAGGGDVWLVKTDPSGNKLWDKTFGGTEVDLGTSVRQTADGGYILTGCTHSFGSGNKDVWLIKTDTSGNRLWDQTFGGTIFDGGNSVQQTSDSGYIVAGYTGSYGAGSYDFWLVRTDTAGNRLWDQTFGGTDHDGCNSVQQTSDGGYVLAGHTRSTGSGDFDFWLVKTDASGNKLWDRTFGGANFDQCTSVLQTSDGGYVVTGITKSCGAGGSDVWLVKTGADGN
jgi:hypothetical protein